MRDLIIFDGDNTLWDTNAVFTRAQKKILKALQAEGFELDPERDFALLRNYDGELIRHFDSPRYDTRYLVYRLIRKSQARELAVDGTEANFNTADGRTQALAERVANEFRTHVHDVPALFPETADLLRDLRERGRYLLALYSDASPSRLARIVAAYELAHQFDVLENGNKSLEDWRRVLQVCLHALRREASRVDPTTYVVGDSLNADIAPGNELGAKTVYKPGGFLGLEMPQTELERPWRIIRTLADLVEIVTTRDV